MGVRIRAAAVLLFGAACTDALPPDPVILSISPDNGPAGQPTVVVIRGRDLALGVHTDFGDPSGTRLETEAVARLGPHVLADAHLVSVTELVARVPAGLPLGTYELVILDGVGREARLAGAYSVRDTVCADLNLAGAVDCAACAGVRGCGCAGNRCAVRCGDGVLFAPELCDDGGDAGGDGCSASCAVEPGYTCTGEPSSCTSTCGDGARAEAEDCDDGNSNDGDGCSAACTIEVAFSCAGDQGATSICASDCGDGALAADETCDDGNTAGGDGCSPGCDLEEGYTCAEGGPCTAICGDGRVRGPEACDDRNLTGGDGCDSLCVIERGFTCAREGEACATACGDSIRAGAETCDDGGIAAGDGCDDRCALEAGFDCAAEGLPCSEICDDGFLAGLEECDDGNVEPGDGCDAACRSEAGFICPTIGAPCTSVCGDGAVAGLETCDDGNGAAGDGCSAVCTIELGYTCPAPNAPCAPVCGDSIVIGGEECDDGNTITGDGCDDDCRPSCGNGAPDPGEECDDGNHADADTCEADCTLPICGNDILDLGEECDDANLTDADGCEADCTLPFCGNGIVDPPELCDDGNPTEGDGCEPDCSRTPTCVDGVRNGVETGVDCGGACPNACISITFPLLGAHVVPDSASPSRGTCTIDISGSRSSFDLTCTHDVVNATSISVDDGIPGANGARVFTLGSPISPIAVTQTITATEAGALLAGRWYVQINSVARPAGDVRGQIATHASFPIVSRQVFPMIATTNTFGACRAWLSPGAASMTMSCTHNVTAASTVRVYRGAPLATGAEMFNLGSGASPLFVTQVMSPAEAADFLNGFLYVNVETAAFPAGELRGQIAQFVETRGGAEQVVPANTVSTANVHCKSFISASGGAWALRCTHDVAGVTGADLRRGAPAVNGPVAFDLGSGASPIDATLLLTPQDHAELQAGDLYLELRSAAFPGGAARAQIATNYTINLDGLQHIPERATVRSGRCLGHLNPARTTIRLECTHDVTDAEVAHLHRCNATCSGLIATPNFANPLSPFQQTVALSVVDVADLVAGNIYVHLHSTTFAGAGELRGQITDLFDFTLDGAQEVPPTGSAATGRCLGFMGFTETPSFAVRCSHDVASPAAMTLNRGAPGVAGPPVQTLSPTATSPVTASTTLSPVLAEELRGGLGYVSVRSAAFPTGEIRGQIVP